MNIYVSNLNFSVGDSELLQLFEEYGEVSSARVITDRYTGRSRGFGFVEMPDDEAAQKAIGELNQVEHEGKVIAVAEARPREDKPRSNNRNDNRRREGGFRDRGRDNNRSW
jgi:RNA recognition motif-containing protein